MALYKKKIPTLVYAIVMTLIMHYFHNPNGQHSVYQENQSGSLSPPIRFSPQGICDDNSQGSIYKQNLGSQSMSRLKNEANLQREREKLDLASLRKQKCWK